MKRLLNYFKFLQILSLIIIIVFGMNYIIKGGLGLLLLTIAGVWLEILSTFMYFLVKRGGDR